MKAINESYIGDSSPVVSDVKDTDAGDTDDARGRSHARRRTAREIAVMFDQLKQRHITRKKEWLEEKEDLLAKLKTAEESKRVLDGLRAVLLNLRTELKDEEDRRIVLEESYSQESEQWMKEKQDLLIQLNEAKKSRDQWLSKDTDMVNLRKKIQDQDEEISQWKKKAVDMQKNLLQQGKQYEEQCKSREIMLQQEKKKWERTKSKMEEEIRNLRERSELNELLYSVRTDTDQEEREQISDTKNKYNEFHRTVNDALREIEKVSDDLRNIDKTKETEKNPKLSVREDSISSLSFSDVIKSDTNETTSTLINAESTNESSQSNSSSNTVKSHLRITKPISPTADNYQKIVRRISQVDIALSSPEIKELTRVIPVKLDNTNNQSPFFPVNESVPLVTSPEGAGKSTMNFYDPQFNNASSKRASFRSMSHTSSDSAAPTYERGRSTSSDIVNNKIKTSYKNNLLNESMRSLNSPSYRSVSPKLPKLHQQLLFKGKELPKEKISMKRFTPSLINTRQSSFSESLSSPAADPKRVNQRTFDQHKCEPTKSNDRDDMKSYTPYFDAKLGYVPRTKPTGNRHASYRLSVDTPESFSSFTSNKSGEDERRLSSNFVSDSNSNVLSDNNARQIAPPVTRPKPNITLEKDNKGNVLGVARVATEPESPVHRNNHNNQSVSQDFVEAPYADIPEVHIPKEPPHTGSMSRGRNWIRKRLNIKDNKKIQPEIVDKIVEPVNHVGQPPNQQREQKKIDRSISFLKPEGKNFKKYVKKRSKSAHGQSSSDESDGNMQKRESFLSWKNRKKNKNKQENDDKRGRKAYNRSNTEGTGFEMRNFLSRFKVSQSNPKKPSIVKQFELKLLENEVKQMNDDDMKGNEIDKRSSLLETGNNVHNTRSPMTPRYRGEKEWNKKQDEKIQRQNNIFSSSSSTISPTLRKQENTSPRSGVKIRPKGAYTKSGKPMYRRSLSDLQSLQIPLKQTFSSNFSNANVINENAANRKRHTAGETKDSENNTEQKSVVSDLIMRFAGHSKPNTQLPPPEKKMIRKTLSAFEQTVPRERSITVISPNRTDPKISRYNSHIGLNIDKDERVESMPKESKEMHEEKKLDFTEKVNMLQKALSKKPVRRYKRADTQPIRVPDFDSTTETSSDEELNEEELVKRNTAMNENIGAVSSEATPSELKFSKPLAPRSRRRPTRWAR